MSLAAIFSWEKDPSPGIEHESQAGLLTGIPVASRRRQTSAAKLRAWWQAWQLPSKRRQRQQRRRCACSRRTLLRAFILVSYTFFGTLVALIVLAYVAFPSYTYPPAHYTELRERVLASSSPAVAGRGNPQQQNVFIAASLFDPDGKLASGDWAENVLALIDLLGADNTYLSIYENDSGADGQLALSELAERVPCQHTLISDDHLGLEGLPQVMTPDGSKRVKRIAYLAEVRNRALAPLDRAPVLYDKVLYLNDVVFDPVDALQLLFSTNQDSSGQTDYRAACAVDFINPFKFYDTFATRDAGGYQTGVPFFPWFSLGGDGRSHSDVVSGKDAVRVRSCWGGMVAYDARFLQKQPPRTTVPATAASEGPSNLTAPYRFRAEADMFWDASECCLIQADIASPDPDHSEIYMNPFVRVAYDSRTLSWLSFTRRFEALYTPIHFMIDVLVSMPHFNPRRDERAWETVDEIVWVPDLQSPEGGAFQNISRIASHSGFCGRRKLPVMKTHFVDGERNYEFIPIPAGSA